MADTYYKHECVGARAYLDSKASRLSNVCSNIEKKKKITYDDVKSLEQSLNTLQEEIKAQRKKLGHHVVSQTITPAQCKKLKK